MAGLLTAYLLQEQGMVVDTAENGQTAIDMLSRLHVDKAFLAANAVDADTLSTPNLEMAGIKSVLIHSANQIILLADSTKLKQKSFAQFARIEDVHTLITDTLAPASLIEKIREKGVEVEQV